jgi:hypothetical protein
MEMFPYLLFYVDARVLENINCIDRHVGINWLKNTLEQF